MNSLFKKALCLLVLALVAGILLADVVLSTNLGFDMDSSEFTLKNHGGSKLKEGSSRSSATLSLGMDWLLYNDTGLHLDAALKLPFAYYDDNSSLVLGSGSGDLAVRFGYVSRTPFGESITCRTALGYEYQVRHMVGKRSGVSYEADYILHGVFFQDIYQLNAGKGLKLEFGTVTSFPIAGRWVEERPMDAEGKLSSFSLGLELVAGISKSF